MCNKCNDKNDLLAQFTDTGVCGKCARKAHKNIASVPKREVYRVYFEERNFVDVEADSEQEALALFYTGVYEEVNSVEILSVDVVKK